MVYREEILTDLRRIWDEKGPRNFVLADSLPCFRAGDKDFLLALNQLLAEGLVVAVQGPESRLGVAINPERIAKMQPTIQNNVTVNIAPGASHVGPIAVGQTIALSYAATAAAPDQLREPLQQLVLAINKLVEAIDSPARKNEIAQDLATFVQQAKSESPSRKLLSVTGDGLLEAAKSVAVLLEPITTSVKAVLSLVGGADA